MKLYLIVGKESSATRLVSRLFEEAGCWSGALDSSHNDYSTRHWLMQGDCSPHAYKKFLEEQGLEVAPKRIVYRTHPTLNYYPILSVVADKFRIIGYEIFWVIVLRRPIRWIKSVTNCKPEDIWGAFREIFRQVQPQEQILFFDSSLLFLDTKRYLQEISFLTDLVFKIPEEIYDADDKYFSIPQKPRLQVVGEDLQVAISDGLNIGESVGKSE